MELNFLDSLTWTASTELDGSSVKLNAEAAGADNSFIDLLANQLNQLSDRAVPNVPNENLIGDIETATIPFLETGGKISPLPAVDYRQLESDNPVQSFFRHLNASTAIIPEPEKSFDSPQAKLPISSFNLNAVMELSSNTNGSAEQVYNSNMEKFTGELNTVLETPEGLAKEIVGVSRETLAANLPNSVPDKQTIATLERPVGKPEWNQELGDRIVWLVNKSRPSAELRLNPPNLGTIEVKIDIVKDQANIAFSSQHAQVREALEAAIPKLREMLGAQNIQLNDIVVAPQSFAGHNQQHSNSQFSGRNIPKAADNTETDQTEISQDLDEENTLTSQGILSLYV